MNVNTSYNALYADGHFEKISTGEMINRGGASGKIFTVIDKPKVVAKIFHSKEKSPIIRKKLEAMVLNRPAIPPVVKDGIEYVQIAWVEAILEDDKGYCVGYLMPLVDMSKAVSLDHLMQKAIRKKLDLSEKYIYRIFAAYNVASMVSSLHNKGHYIVDLKPSNVSVYKENMLVAMVDCDGFSIKGERNNRYPAEFVSEEYIYPEGMNMACEDMGEEQDKFALAVIIFRLLNNGIHPFSGIPRKADAHMLTIQKRIEDYHYAYGLWPDSYQEPHPYSIHEYFDKKTLELFERAFAKGLKRPSATEWQMHLYDLLQNVKTCKKDNNHVYFTAKGCGLCISEQKFSDNLSGIKKKKETPEMVRGIEVSKISVESMKRTKTERQENLLRTRNIVIGLMSVYMIFFALLHPILMPFKDSVTAKGIGIQIFVITLVMLGINTLFKRFYSLPLVGNRSLKHMMQMFALICMVITLISLNNISLAIFSLAK